MVQLVTAANSDTGKTRTLFEYNSACACACAYSCACACACVCVCGEGGHDMT
jgi:hypothetical protein